MNPRSRSQSLSLGALCLSAALLQGCVSQQKYDEMARTASSYQRSLQEAGQYQMQLEAENERLAREVELFQGASTVPASLTADVDARLDELRALVAGLGEGPDDVTLFEVEGGYGFSVKEAIVFDSGSDEIRSAGRTVLASLARDIESRPFRRIWVRGHTDSDPIKRSADKFPLGNLQLSAARALRVADLLIREGKIAEQRVCVAGFGPGEPLAPNDNATNKQKNRRVEIFVMDEAGAGAEPARKVSNSSSNAAGATEASNPSTPAGGTNTGG
jgi:flagellar motor protein MotB